MEITIIGAGEVGRAIATDLATSHKVTIVDIDNAVTEEITYSLDVLAVTGDGRDLDTLRQANVAEADLVVASTDNDEINTIICGTAKSISTAFTIARVRKEQLYKTWQSNADAFGVDYMVSTNILTARAVFRISGLSSAQDVDTFADGLVQMAKFEIEPGSPILNQPVEELDEFDSLTFAAVFRGSDTIIIPTGDTTFLPHDRVVVIGSTSSVTEFATVITTCPRNLSDDIVLIGASEIGTQIAQEFEQNGHGIRLIESDADRARTAAEALESTTVLCADPTDLQFLQTEHIDKADLVISALPNDEQNLFVSLVAHHIGVDESVAIVERDKYTDLFETVGIDVTVNPREEVAEEIIRFTHLLPTEKLVMLENDKAEVIEFKVTPDSLFSGNTISNTMENLSGGVVIGAIERAGNLVTPRGSTVIKPGDHIIMFAHEEVINEVVGTV